MSESLHYPTVILGAGLCGLSAAYHLEEKGRTDYLVLERDDTVGGLARTATYDGFSFDHAIHILYSSNAYARDLICNTFLRGELHAQERRSYCYSCGVYSEYPYQINTYGLPPDVVVENIMGLIEARYNASRNGPPPHFEAWIYETFGKGIADNFMAPYNRRVWAWDLKDMSYDWIADRVLIPDIRDVLRGALGPQKKYGPNQEFWYPLEGGIETLPKAILRFIPSERLWRNAAVVGLDGARREVFLADGRRVRYDRLISTLPLPLAVKLLGDDVPATIRQCAAGLKSNAVHTVNIGLEGTDLGTGAPMHWVYFPEDATIFHRISFPCHFSPWMVPPGCSSLQVEISESIHMRRNRATLIQQSVAHLVGVGILRERDARSVSEGGRIRVAEVVTLDPAYIIFDLSHSENTQTVKEYLQRLDIFTGGRFGDWEYLNMDQAILRGSEAAEEMAG